MIINLKEAKALVVKRQLDVDALDRDPSIQKLCRMIFDGRYIPGGCPLCAAKERLSVAKQQLRMLEHKQLPPEVWLG